MPLNRRQLAKLATIISKLEGLQFDIARRNDAAAQVAVRRLSAAKAELQAILRGEDWR